jgi:glyoxylase-like metal-dependent hydrolase (beta-lactamase superfamily II)
MADHALHVLDLSWFTVPTGAVIHSGGNDPMQVPIPGFVITHPKGNVLFDSGWPRECLTEGTTHFPGMDPPFEIHMEPEHHVVEAIRLAGLDPASITTVVQTHLHVDHVGGIGEFPDAQFLVHRADWDYAHDPDWYMAYGYTLRDIDKPGVDWKILDTPPDDPMYDVYGDGRIKLQVSPGHSPGQFALVAKLQEQTIMLTGDAANTIGHWNYEMLSPFLDMPAYTRSIKRLHKIAEAEGVDQIFFGHDPEQFPELKKGKDAYT